MTDFAAWSTAVVIGRWVNIVLASAALIVLFTAVSGWRYRSAGNRFLWMAIALFLANTVFGTAEQMLNGQPGGWRTAVTTVTVVWLIASLVTKRRGRWYPEEYPRGRNGRHGRNGGE
jgi:hypothetical protein